MQRLREAPRLFPLAFERRLEAVKLTVEFIMESVDPLLRMLRVMREVVDAAELRLRVPKCSMREQVEHLIGTAFLDVAGLDEMTYTFEKCLILRDSTHAESVQDFLGCRDCSKLLRVDVSLFCGNTS